MNYKLFLIILLILTIIMTSCICIMKPQMHKSVLVYNSDYKLEPKQEVTIEQKTLPTMPSEPQKQIVTQNTIQPVQTQKVELKPKVIHIFRDSQPAKKIEIKSTTTNIIQPKQQVKTQVQTQPKTITKTDYNIDVKQIAQRTAQNVQKPQTTFTQNTITTNPSTRIQYTPPAKTKPVQSQTTVKTTPVQKVLTVQEEEILWNRWRSNLQNQIMKDVKLPTIPTGTVFRFTFNVDKYGKISNVQTWSDTSKYTPHAIQYIAPVIRSYQGRSILNFPVGSNRTNTQVSGGWKISPNAKFSTPQDYNDTERITK